MRSEYNTRQKREMLQYLSGHSAEHYTVDGFVEAMKGAGVAVGKTTAYRFLESMREQGKARKYTSGQSSVCMYQFIEDDSHCDSHFHLVCLACGALYHVDCAHLVELSAHIRRAHGFQIDARQTVLAGICEKCASEDVGRGEADGPDHTA